MEFKFRGILDKVLGAERPREVIQREINKITSEYEVLKVKYHSEEDFSLKEKMKEELKLLNSQRQVLINERDRNK